MKKTSQVLVKRKTLSDRLSRYRSVFVCMAYRAGLTMEEVGLIFGTTKQNVQLMIKQEKNDQ